MNTKCIAIATLLSLSLFARGPKANAATQMPDIGWTQRLGQSLPLEQLVTDENGFEHLLGDLFSHQPVVLVFAYYRCPNLCTLVFNGLAQTIMQNGDALGADYQVLALSIDPKERPALALMKERTYLARINRPANDSSWHFLTARESSIQTITKAAGFEYRYDPVSQQFAHPSGVVIVSSDGKIRQYLMGIQFEPKEFHDAITKATNHHTGSLAEEIMLFCSHYDFSSSTAGKRTLLLVRLLSAFFAPLFLILLARAFLRKDQK
jgi:protein SCO1/2